MKTTPYIFIDTCSLLDSCWVEEMGGLYRYSPDKDRRFWGEEFVSLQKMGSIILPHRNYEELRKHAGNKANQNLAERSKLILKRIEPLIRSESMQIVGDPNDPFADAILLSVALKFRTQRDMAFITQDHGLAEDLEAIRNFKSVRPRHGYDIKIRRIAESGRVKPFENLLEKGDKQPKKNGKAAAKAINKKHQKSTNPANWWER